MSASINGTASQLNIASIIGDGNPLALAYAAVPMTDANLVLSSAQYVCPVLGLSGALTATRAVTTVLVAGAIAIVINGTTGGESVTFGGATGATVTITNGSVQLCVCDGVNWKAVS